MSIPLTICKECKWPEREKLEASWIEPPPAEIRALTGVCLNLKTPLVDYVEGRRSCREINSDGRCPYFEKGGTNTMTISHESRRKGRRLLRIAQKHKALTGQIRRRLERHEKQLSDELTSTMEPLMLIGREEG